MIAGPILPRTADGLWEAIRKDPERLEHGLRVIRRELVLHAGLGPAGRGGSSEEGLVIDAVGADAVGAPVLFFVAQIEQDRCIPARIAEACDWFARNASMLTPILDGDGVRLDLAARVFVVGFEFTASCLDRLALLAQISAAGGRSPVDVSAFRIEGMVLDGVHHIGVARVLGAGGDVRLAAAEGSEVGKRCEQLAELLECLDPELTQDAERFARTWRCQGTTILRLERNSRRLRAVVPGHGVVEIVHEEDLTDACDLAMRRYLTVVRGEDGDLDEGVDPAEPEVERFQSVRRVESEDGIEADELDVFFAEDNEVKGAASRGDVQLSRGMRRGESFDRVSDPLRRGGSVRAQDGKSSPKS
ncbi:MAG: hypothetical protein O2865_02725 [Planctomycetota bacterium]|nr:hypothetical protein [Planctomycetota bacterium]MDA0932616.1 hypothetical protein [Planctomycetota bacterium]